jgi:hypothetical protein
MKTKTYKSNNKQKIYSGEIVNKGFYDKNLIKAHYLYTKNNWQPPRPIIVKKMNKKTLNQKINKYMNEYKALKQKFNLPELEEETKESEIVDPNSEEFGEKKILISNKIIDGLEKYFETNKFIITDKIIDSMKDYRNYNFNNNDFSYLKNIQNTKDYNIRLYQKENELLEQLNEYENKNNSINNKNNEGIIDENYGEKFNKNKKIQIIDNSGDENIIENKEEDNYDKKINKNNLNDEKNNENRNEDESLNNKNKKVNNGYQLFESLIRNEYNKEYIINNNYNDNYRQYLEEIEDLYDNKNCMNVNKENKEEVYYESEIKKIDEEDDKEEGKYENEFKNEENKVEDKEVDEYENEFNEKLESSKTLTDEIEKGHKLKDKEESIKI